MSKSQKKPSAKKSASKKSKKVMKSIDPKTLRRVLVGLGIAAAAVVTIIAALHAAPLFVALLTVLGFFAALAVLRRILTLDPTTA